jgi:hypothetical protein
MKSLSEAPAEEPCGATIGSVSPSALAFDPTTPPEVLEELARGNDPRIRFSIALNPNAPEELLRELWMEHPSAILENPIVSYRALASGNRFHELLPDGVKLALYGFLRSAGRDADLEAYLPESDRREWFASNWNNSQPVRLPPPLMENIHRQLATDPSLPVRDAMLTRLPHTQLPLFAKDPDDGIRLKLAKRIPDAHPRADKPHPEWPIVIDILCTDASQKVRVAVAAASCLTPFAFWSLANDPSKKVRLSLAREGRGEGSREMDWLMLAAGSEELSQAVAANGGCPQAVLLELTGHPSRKVRTLAWKGFNLKWNPASEKRPRQLETLFADPLLEPERIVVAANRTLTATVTDGLMRGSISVLRTLASNPQLPDAQRMDLLRHPDEETALAAMRHSFTSKVVKLGAAHPNSKVRAVVAGMVGRHASALRCKLAADPCFEVRQEVRHYVMRRIGHYQGVNISKTLDVLARDPVAKIRAKVACDPRLPNSALERLAKDPSVRVRLEVLKYSRSPVGHLGLLDLKAKGVRLKAAEILMRRRYHGGHRGGNMPLDVYRKIATDSSPSVRVVAAETEHLPLEILGSMIQDESPDVQQTLVARNFPKTLKGARHSIDQTACRSLRELEAHRNPICRAAAASISTAGKLRLQRLVSDPCWFVRAMLVKNAAGLELPQLERLAQDPHPIVRASAQNRIHYHLNRAKRLSHT